MAEKYIHEENRFGGSNRHCESKQDTAAYYRELRKAQNADDNSLLDQVKVVPMKGSLKK